MDVRVFGVGLLGVVGVRHRQRGVAQGGEASGHERQDAEDECVARDGGHGNYHSHFGNGEQ